MTETNLKFTKKTVNGTIVVAANKAIGFPGSISVIVTAPVQYTVDGQLLGEFDIGRHSVSDELASVFKSVLPKELENPVTGEPGAN
jgi:hypothetical protein